MFSNLLINQRQFANTPKIQRFFSECIKLYFVDSSLSYIFTIRFFGSVLYFENHLYFGITSYFSSVWCPYSKPGPGMMSWIRRGKG